MRLTTENIISRHGRRDSQAGGWVLSLRPTSGEQFPNIDRIFFGLYCSGAANMHRRLWSRKRPSSWFVVHFVRKPSRAKHPSEQIVILTSCQRTANHRQNQRNHDAKPTRTTSRTSLDAFNLPKHLSRINIKVVRGLPKPQIFRVSCTHFLIYFHLIKGVQKIDIYNLTRFVVWVKQTSYHVDIDSSCALPD